MSVVVSSFINASAAGVGTDGVVGPPFDPTTITWSALIHTSILFFAFVMLTEPLTTPPTRARRIAYGALIGVLFAPGIHFGTIHSTPELALIVGNIFSYAISPKRKYILKLKSVQKFGADIYDFIFTADRKISFKPGQYMEWTLPATNPPADTRGNRRYFTIASSPTELELHLGIRYYEPSSTFKKKLLALRSGDEFIVSGTSDQSGKPSDNETIIAGQLSGDFTLPNDPAKNWLLLPAE